MDERVAKRTLYAAAADVEKEDVENILERKSEFDDKLHDVPDRFTKLVKQLQLLFELMQDWWGGRYKGVPWLSITMAAAAVLYFVNPLDIIPDVIPIVGYLDDAVVVGLAIAALKEDLKKYCAAKGYRLADYF